MSRRQLEANANRTPTIAKRSGTHRRLGAALRNRCLAIQIQVEMMQRVGTLSERVTAVWKQPALHGQWVHIPGETVRDRGSQLHIMFSFAQKHDVY